MGITLRTPLDKVISELVDAKRKQLQRVVNAMSYLGEQVVTIAKDRKPEESWVDHSGNLRSSIGYVIAQDGEIVRESSFTTILNGYNGSLVGKSLAYSVALKKRGIVLVVVAGMNYADLVEAIKGKDVLATPEQYARANLPRMLQQLGL